MEAMDRIDIGARRPKNINTAEQERTAYHEVGHLVATYYFHPTHDVFKASIVARGDTLGVVQHQPKEETFSESREIYLANIKVALAGYCMEKIRYGVTSSGVISDFRNAMARAHSMVWSQGMGSNGFIGDYTLIPAAQLSEAMKEKLNAETQQILSQCEKDVTELLTREHKVVERFVAELLEKKELDYDQIYAIFNEYGEAKSAPVQIDEHGRAEENTGSQDAS
ncbi:MAG: hypothetical protein JW937_10005, partial [Candidatus Omnitrophica bacterium]|nr:hypothetical protein [Candidatus Omnitrophota bacterium]